MESAQTPAGGGHATPTERSTLSSTDTEKQAAPGHEANPQSSEALEYKDGLSNKEAVRELVSRLSWTDIFLTPMIIVAMIIGVVIGEFAPNVHANLNRGNLIGVSAPLVVGLILMMVPILTKVKYEEFPRLFRTRSVWTHICVSIVLNWLIGPFIMLALAWATLPDLPEYRTGVILVGIARCIAMVNIWTSIARGDTDMCALLVIVNSILQIVLFAPMAVFFVKVISGYEIALTYDSAAKAVGIYLGIPLAAGMAIRFLLLAIAGRRFLETKFLPVFGSLTLIALLYTIIIIFAEQARQILDHLGPVFRTMVPLVLYFTIMFGGTFGSMWLVSRRSGKKEEAYRMAVVQAFTAGSNNFELAIAVAVAVYGSTSPVALAATIGPLVEVPVLLILAWVCLFARHRLQWGR